MNKADLKRAQELSQRLSVGLGGTPRQKNVASPRAYLVESAPPNTSELMAIIEPLVKRYVESLPPQEMEITPEVAKKIVQTMHGLAENDKLEVSKGIRNASSFIYNGTKYGTHEMMHGGAAPSSSITFVDNEVVAGSNLTWTLANTPTLGSVQLYGNGQFLTPGGVDYTISATHITTINPFSAGTIIASYRY